MRRRDVVNGSVVWLFGSFFHCDSGNSELLNDGGIRDSRLIELTAVFRLFIWNIRGGKGIKLVYELKMIRD